MEDGAAYRGKYAVRYAHQNTMDKIYVVLNHGEVDSAYVDPNKASHQIADLIRFEDDNVMYDEHGYAQSESGAIKMVEVYVQG